MPCLWSRDASRTLWHVFDLGLGLEAQVFGLVLDLVFALTSGPALERIVIISLRCALKSNLCDVYYGKSVDHSLRAYL